MTYQAKVTMRNGASRRMIHDLIDGKRAGIMEANQGQRGWLWYYNPEEGYYPSPYHRLHTSVIQSVENDNNSIVITTQNTVYRLDPVKE